MWISINGWKNTSILFDVLEKVEVVLANSRLLLYNEWEMYNLERLKVKEWRV